MRPADTWKDYELLDATDGNRLERWGETILIRPDPQVVWKTPKQSPLWAKADAVYHRSNQGGGEWEYKRRLPEKWKIHCGEGDDRLTLIVSPTGFKHTGVFPEQAVNWAWYQQKIRAAGRPVKVLNLFGYTGGATLACAAAGATVCHVDASKGIVAWGKDGQAPCPAAWPTSPSAGWWTTAPGFVARESAAATPMTASSWPPPSYGRGPGGEIWKLEDCIYDLISQCEEVLSDKPLFFAVNSYTTGLSPAVMEYMLTPRWYPGLAARPAAMRSACRCPPPAAWCPAVPRPSGKNKRKRPRPLSQTLRVCQLSQRESLWREGQLSGFAKGSPLGRAGASAPGGKAAENKQAVNFQQNGVQPLSEERTTRRENK